MQKLPRHIGRKRNSRKRDLQDGDLLIACFLAASRCLSDRAVVFGISRCDLIAGSHSLHSENVPTGQSLGRESGEMQVEKLGAHPQPPQRLSNRKIVIGFDDDLDDSLPTAPLFELVSGLGKRRR